MKVFGGVLSFIVKSQCFDHLNSLILNQGFELLKLGEHIFHSCHQVNLVISRGIINKGDIVQNTYECR